MFGNNSSTLQPMRDAFLAQFAPDGDGYIYREDGKGRAVRITATEYARFVADYEATLSGYRWKLWGIIGGTILLWSLWIFLQDKVMGSDGASLVLVIAFIPPIIWLTISGKAARTAPSKRLDGRPSIARPLSSDEARLDRMQRITWLQLSGGPLAVAYFYFKYGPKSDFLSGFNSLWTLGAVASLAFCGYGAWLKLRAGSADNNEAHH